MVDKLNRYMPDDEVYSAVQRYLLDDKKPWGCLPLKDKQGNHDRVLFLGVPGAQIRLYLDYESNSDKWFHRDLVIHFLGDTTYRPTSFFYNMYGTKDPLLGFVRNLDTNADAIHYKELFIRNADGMRELAESVYQRVYGGLNKTLVRVPGK